MARSASSAATIGFDAMLRLTVDTLPHPMAAVVSEQSDKRSPQPER
jgi:hypothetical protein